MRTHIIMEETNAFGLTDLVVLNKRPALFFIQSLKALNNKLHQCFVVLPENQ
jgi:hypothetical protein